MAEFLSALISSYLVGAIPTGYLLVKQLKRIDIRRVGSGNVGATNVTRAAGAAAGGVVFCLDVAKGLIAVGLIAPWLADPASRTVRLGCGLMAVIGHSAPVFLRFRGGKGVATTIGVLLGTMPGVAAICLAVWIACFAVWRYVSVGSLAAALALPLTQAAMQQHASEILLGSALALLIIVRHRTNLQRLLRGEEHWVSLRKDIDERSRGA